MYGGEGRGAQEPKIPMLGDVLTNPIYVGFEVCLLGVVAAREHKIMHSLSATELTGGFPGLIIA